jgi:hypothetical protein
MAPGGTKQKCFVPCKARRSRSAVRPSRWAKLVIRSPGATPASYLVCAAREALARAALWFLPLHV